MWDMTKEFDFNQSKKLLIDQKVSLHVHKNIK